MLRPNKGEGERPAPRTNNKNKDKRPLTKAVICPTVVFFAVSPILLASQAMAATPMSTSAFGLLPSAQQSQTQPGTAQGALFQRLLGTNPNLGTYVFPRQSPSSEELSSRLATLKNTLTQQTQKLNQANQALSSAKSVLASAQGSLSQLNAKVETTKTALATAKFELQKAETAVSTAKAALATADAEVTQQTNILNTAQAALQVAQANLLAATSNLSQAQANHTATQAALTSAQADATSASSDVTQAQNTYTQAQQAYQAAQANTNAKLQLVQTAQAAYDSSQVPNPNYVAPYTTNTIPNLLFNSDFSRGNEGWSGLSIGWQNSQPGYFNGNIVFSYMNQTVSQGLYSGPFNNATLTLSAEWYNDDSNRNITDSYSMTVSARDINQNPVGSATFTSDNTRHNWETKSATLVATGPVSFITIEFSGVDNGFWAGNYGPHLRNPQLQVSSQTSTNNPQATQTGTIQVQLNEGDTSTFTAPNGGIFVSSNLRYEAIDDPTCGTNVTPEGFGSNTITLSADNGVWGDPCGGWYKQLVGTLTYSTAQPQFIKDPSLLAVITTAQTNYTQAQQEEDAAYDDYVDAYDELVLAQSEQTDADSDVSAATSAVQAAASALATSTQGSSVATSAVTNAQSTYDQELAKLTAATANTSTARSEVSSSEATLSSATTSTQTLEVEVNNLVSDTSAAQSDVTTAEGNVSAASAEVTAAEADITSTTARIAEVEAEIASIPEPTPTPTPEPEPEPEEPEIVVLPSLEDLTKVNFEEIVATDLTAAQAEEIKEAALETFLTAEQGSPVYEAALQALFVAAQQNDITVDPGLAEIPGVGAAAVALIDAVNFLGNAGADMSPQVREESEKVVVTAVVAGNAAIAAAAGAASSATAAAATSSGGGASGGSSSGRRIK